MNGSFHLGDCLDVMPRLATGSVDMILCDLPYGTTQNKWDTVIPFEPLWREYWRLLRPNGAVVLTASQPFTSALVMSQIDQFAYSWVWNKAHGSNPLLAKRRPMNRHEDVCVFSPNGSLPTYRPQMEKTEPFRSRRGAKTNGIQRPDNYGERSNQEYVLADERYPTTDLYFSSGARLQSIHPTQKPVELFEYLIRTYTDEGMTVLDNCAGSGTTAVAAERTGRKWICIERDPIYYVKAVHRIATL